MPFHINEDGTVALSFSEGEVIHPKNVRCFARMRFYFLKGIEESIGTDEQSKGFSDSSGCLSANEQCQLSQSLG